MAKEPFREVAEAEMIKVLESLRKDWPKHFLLHQILTVVEEYKKAGSKLRNTLYLCGDYDTGVYLSKLSMKLPTMTRYFVHVYSPSCDLEPVKIVLKHTQVIPWNENFGFEIVQSRYTEAIQETFASKGLSCDMGSTTMFWYPPEKKLNFLPMPDDVCLDFLDGSFAEEMNRNWPYKYPGSEIVIRENLEINFGLGLLRKTDKRLVCSAMSNYSGGMFTLYTDPEFRGRSYAKILVQHMVKELRLRNRVPFGTVIKGNLPSEKMFSQCGFEYFVDVEYIFPKKDV